MSRKSVKNFLKQVKNPYPIESQSYTAWEKGFIEGFNSSEATPCFEENDLLDFANYLRNSEIISNKNLLRKDEWLLKGETIISRELLNLWKQSKSK